MAQAPVDLALIDINLAGTLNGIETATQIRARFDIPVVHLTNCPVEAERAAELAQANEQLRRKISEHELTEKALWESIGLFHQITEHTKVVFWVIDRESRQVISINPACEEIWGRTQVSLCAEPDSWFGDVHPGDRERVRSGFRQLCREGGHYNEVYRIVWPDGSIRWVQDRGFLIRHDLEESDRIARIVMDATRYKQAEKSLRHRNRELTLLNRVIATSAASLEQDIILETACRELAMAWGMPQASAFLLNKKMTKATVVAEYLTAGRPPALNEVVPVEGNPVIRHLLIDRAPLIVTDVQSTRYDRSHMLPVRDFLRRRGTVSLLLLPLVIQDEVVGALMLETIEQRDFPAEEVSLAWNVADQVAGALARVRLAQSHQRLSTVIEQSAESVVISDTRRTIVYVNPAFEQISGYSHAEALGQRFPHLLRSYKHPTAFYQALEATVEAGQVWRGRIINKKKDGAFYTEDAVVTPIRNESGAIVNYVQVSRDMTRELQLEEQYQQAQKMEAVGQLAGGIAHDFNNLLTVMMGYTGLALQKLPSDNPIRSDIEIIQKNAEHAANLTRQLLIFARRQPIEPKVLDLNDIILPINKMMRRIIGEDIEVVTRSGPDLGQIKADPGQLEQVLLNLVINARDAMPDGGKLTIETANVTFDDAYAGRHAEVTAGEYVMLAVSDNGLGMTKEVKSRIFEPFFTTKETGKGTGLGLATVFGIVKQSDGHIWVYSEEGQGTTFKVYLPRIEQAGKSLKLCDQAGIFPRGTETVLLAEDEPMVREVVGSLGLSVQSP